MLDRNFCTGQLKFVGRWAVCLVLAGLICGEARADTTKVVTTIYPLELLVQEIGGSRVSVTTLLPPGVSPHSFDPKPSDVIKIQRSQVFLSVGGSVDEWLEELPFEFKGNHRLRLLSLEGLDALAVNHDGELTEDPHVWLDPLRVRDHLAPAIAAVLADVDPGKRKFYNEKLRKFQKRLTALDLQLREQLQGGGAYVAFHRGWSYFAQRYGLRAVATVQEGAGESPTPKGIVRVIQAARASGVRGILIEPQLNPRMAEVIAAEFGAGTVWVDLLGNPEDPERSTYEKLMLWNARAFVKAMNQAEPIALKSAGNR